MKNIHNKNLVTAARNLRKNMTAEEKHLWYDFLRVHPLKFMRQKIVGNYILDFYCAELKLAIELDGSQHYKDGNIEKDIIRTAFLNEYGIEVIRIPNNEINLNFDNVCMYPEKNLKNCSNRRNSNLLL